MLIFKDKFNFALNVILAFFLYVFKVKNKIYFKQNKMRLEMNDKDLFENMEALRQAIDRIEQKEQLAVQKTVETSCSEENSRQ